MAGFAALCCYSAGYEIIHRLQGSLILAEDPIDSTKSLAAEERWAEVKMMTDFLVERPDLVDSEQVGSLSRQADLELNSFWGQTQSFAQGAVTGEPTDLASMLGSLSLDLFVIGDIRDLAVQGWKQIQYGSGDTLILALSAIGLTTTLAPHLDWAPALMKALTRTGALTSRFMRSLTRTSREAIKTGQYTKLSGVVTDLGKAAKRLGPGPLRGVTRSVDSAEDLAKVAKAAEIDAKGTYFMTRMFGKDGVKLISKDGKNIGLLVTSVKTGSRLTKLVHKSVGVVPTMWLSLILALSIAVLISVAVPRPRRKVV
ncbi:MAG: hypothetical protein QNI91_05005 [Arenicellales bacterium]|nr:hypothetical protein [Arenicellales bacterium]